MKPIKKKKSILAFLLLSVKNNFYVSFSKILKRKISKACVGTKEEEFKPFF